MKSVFEDVKKMKVMLIDTIREDQARIGKDYPFKGRKLSMGECIIHYNSFEDLESTVGSVIWVRLNSVR